MSRSQLKKLVKELQKFKAQKQFMPLEEQERELKRLKYEFHSVISQQSEMNGYSVAIQELITTI